MKKIFSYILCICMITVSCAYTAAAAEIPQPAAEYLFDSDKAVNAADENTYIINPKLVKDYEYDTGYYIQPQKGNAAISDLGTELAALAGDNFTVDIWFKNDSSVGNAERRVMSVADKKTYYFMLGLDNNRMYVCVSYTNEDGKNILAHYKSDLIVGNGWNHAAFSFDRSAGEHGLVTAALNGAEATFGAPVGGNMSTPTNMEGAFLPTVPEDARFYLNGTNKMISWTYGTGFCSSFKIGAFSVYKGAGDAEFLQGLMNKNADRYDESYDLILKQNETDIPNTGLLTDISEKDKFTAVLKLDENESIGKDTVYLYDKANDSRVEYSGISYEDGAYKIDFNAAAGDYKFIIDKSVANSQGKEYRKNDYVLNICVALDNEYRAAIRNGICAAAQEALKEEPDYEALKSELLKYSDFLKLEYEYYDKSIGKDKIIKAVAEYILENADFEFDGLRTQFETVSKNQCDLDFVDAIAEINEILSKDLITAQEAENIVFVKYASCINVPEEVKSEYEKLLKKDGVWKLLKGKKYDTSNINESIDAFISDFSDKILYETELELFEGLAGADADEFIKKLEEIAGKYPDVGIDINNEDYKKYTSETAKELMKKTLTPENAEREFYRALAAVCLNFTETGDRGRISEVLDGYGKYIDFPKEYTDGVKTDIHKKIIGKTYTADTLESVIKKAAEEAKNIERGGGGTTSRTPSGGGISGAPTIYNPSESGVETIKKNEEELKISFGDLDKAPWAEESILALTEKGVINGKSKNEFAPNDTVTREEFIKMIILAFGITGDGDMNFSDVDENQWYYRYIKSAYVNKIVSGKDNDIFGIGENITREDMAVIIGRVMDLKQITLENKLDKAEFSDEADISQYAMNDVLVLAKKGILSGMGNGEFNPQGSATRAQAAKVIYSILENNSL